MKVRARQNVRDGSGWHFAGQIFETETDLGEAVEVLDIPSGPSDHLPLQQGEAVKQENIPLQQGEAVKQEEPAETPKPRSRRKTTK